MPDANLPQVTLTPSFLPPAWPPVLKEKLRWSDGLAFGLIFSGVIVSLVLKPKVRGCPCMAAVTLPGALLCTEQARIWQSTGCSCPQPACGVYLVWRMHG